jgi:hypothetical protein
VSLFVQSGYAFGLRRELRSARNAGTLAVLDASGPARRLTPDTPRGSSDRGDARGEASGRF